MLFTFLLISFGRYKKYMICLILFSKFSDILPAFTYARLIDNFLSIWLGLNILRFEWLETLRLETLVMGARAAKAWNFFSMNCFAFNLRYN